MWAVVVNLLIYWGWALPQSWFFRFKTSYLEEDKTFGARVGPGAGTLTGTLVAVQPHSRPRGGGLLLLVLPPSLLHVPSVAVGIRCATGRLVATALLGADLGCRLVSLAGRLAGGCAELARPRDRSACEPDPALGQRWVDCDGERLARQRCEEHPHGVDERLALLVAEEVLTPLLGAHRADLLQLALRKGSVVENVPSSGCELTAHNRPHVFDDRHLIGDGGEVRLGLGQRPSEVPPQGGVLEGVGFATDHLAQTPVQGANEVVAPHSVTARHQAHRALEGLPETAGGLDRSGVERRGYESLVDDPPLRAGVGDEVVAPDGGHNLIGVGRGQAGLDSLAEERLLLRHLGGGGWGGYTGRAHCNAPP